MLLAGMAGLSNDCEAAAAIDAAMTVVATKAPARPNLITLSFTHRRLTRRDADFLVRRR
jgi:hypothetical protein